VTSQKSAAKETIFHVKNIEKPLFLAIETVTARLILHEKRFETPT